MTEKWPMTEDAQDGGVAGRVGRARFQCVIRVSFIALQAGWRFPNLIQTQQKARCTAYSIRLLFTRIICFLSEKGEEGREGGEEETSPESDKGLLGP